MRCLDQMRLKSRLRSNMNIWHACCVEKEPYLTWCLFGMQQQWLATAEAPWVPADLPLELL